MESQMNLELNTPLDDLDKKRIDTLGNEWFYVLRDALNSPRVREVANFVGVRRKETVVYPERDNTFKAFKLTPWKEVKVVILGQDPYHNGQADGLAFSSATKDMPKSLNKVFNGIQEDLGVWCVTPHLQEWAKQGVLLLNTCLTVEKGMAGSHLGKGWEVLTTTAIKSLNKKQTPVCYLLWGNEAKTFRNLIVNPFHLVLEAEHPASALYRGEGSPWIHNKCFSKCNEYLEKNGVAPIVWQAVNEDVPF